MLADGSITTTAPATLERDRFVFRQASGTWAKNAVDAGAKGVVRFRGHYENDHYAMNLTLSSPRIVFTTGGGGKVVMDAINSEGETLKGVTVATLDLKGRVTTAKGQVTITDAPATLSVAGNKLFAYQGNPFYKPGDALDPVSATFDVENAVGLDFGSAPTTPSPGGSDEPTKPGPTKPAKPAKPGVDREREAAQRGGKAGELSWGVKASFRSYITGPIARGSVSVSGGASARRLAATASARPPPRPTPPNATGTTSYRGARERSTATTARSTARSRSRPSASRPRSSAVLSANVSGLWPGRHRHARTWRAAQRSDRDRLGPVRRRPGDASPPPAPAIFAYQGRGFYPAGHGARSRDLLGRHRSRPGGGGATRSSPPTHERRVDGAGDAARRRPASPSSRTRCRAGDEVTASGSGFLAERDRHPRGALLARRSCWPRTSPPTPPAARRGPGTIPATIEPGKHTLTFQGSVDRGVVIDVAEAEKIVGCELTDGRLDWGFKESFRAYVSGSIANGDWTTQGGASYETPEFTWSKGEGVLDEKTRAGELEFAADHRVHRPRRSARHHDREPGRDASPTQSSAALSVDYTGGTMDAAMAGQGRQPDARRPSRSPTSTSAAGDGRPSTARRVTIGDIPATLTSAGSAAFPNYETGAALDPVTLDVHGGEGLRHGRRRSPPRATTTRRPSPSTR